jgi:general secretion pathway protein J
MWMIYLVPYAVNDQMMNNVAVHPARGFTLIEMLVVLVILSLTTSLLSTGLSTTWRNFERLGARSLMNSSAQLALSWFEQSIKGAQLYHPDTAVFSGNSNEISFISTKVPNDARQQPQTMHWRIHSNAKGWHLSFSSETHNQSTVITTFNSQPVFEYLSQEQWFDAFAPKDGRLPIAIRIRLGDRIWVLANPGRPVLADIPPELPLYGKYEF